jgi:hypothetical protein
MTQEAVMLMATEAMLALHESMRADRMKTMKTIREGSRRSVRRTAVRTDGAALPLGTPAVAR